MWPQLSLPRFDAEIESLFQANYYARVRSTLRLVAPLIAALLLLQLSLSARLPAPYDLTIAVPQIWFWVLLFGLTWVPGFARCWQPVALALGWASAALVLGRLAPLLTQDITRMQAQGTLAPTDAQQKFYFMLQFAVLAVGLTMLRLQFRWAVLLYVGVAAISIRAFLADLPATSDLFGDVRFAFLPGLLIICVLLLTSFIQEQLARGAFLANHQLEAERNDEKRRREATEGKLQVLAQAIGGIVHDLGNPLTTVQMGASTLDLLVDEEDTDRETLHSVTGMIGSGAEMLNYLRLSLIEQTRVLEGKPTPIDAQPIALRGILQAGARFQKPHVLGQRALVIEGEELLARADEMKMVTVFMNLIGNALKYSDGEVRVAWRHFERAEPGSKPMLCIAVLDQGTQGRGITSEQAGRLFTAFGRLEAHSEIEGTGLGLLSVQNIVEAHGGEVFVEGYDDGAIGSPSFSTAKTPAPSMLSADYRTAFVVTCPQASAV